MSKRKGPWSYTAGSYPYSVRVYERGQGGVIYASVWDPTARGGEGGEKRWSLRTRDKDEAKAWADEQTVELRKSLGEAVPEQPTVRRIFKLYRRHRTPDKGDTSQQEDDRQIELWRRFLGASFDLSRLSRREWDRFKRQRAAGIIGPRGKPVPEKKRRAVGARTVEKDCRWLRAVCRWALDYRDDTGRLLLERDPTRGLEIPSEKNPKRPVATHDRVDAIREHYTKPTMRVERKGKRQRVESYLPEIFEIVVGTGRRISAVCSLRSEDVELERTEKAPWGAIVWPEDTDKMDKRWRCPISPAVRKALEAAIRKRASVGPGPLFPSCGDPSEPIRYEEASVWLREAEDAAELEPQQGTLWHAYRRLWASSRKDLPDVDVAQAGGWSSLEALRQAYQQPDDATMLRVVTHEAELREVR